MYQILQLFTICLFAGSTCAVFYIPGTVVSYPKMGKRAFYTNATGNRYPLMGRRASHNDRDKDTQENSVGALVQENNEYNKRGVFTQGPHRSYPRVGRAGPGPDAAAATMSGRIRNEILKSLTERLNRNALENQDGDQVRAALESQGQEAGEDNSAHSAQLSQFLFLIFDEDGDDQLSKSEFQEGVAKMMEQNLLC